MKKIIIHTEQITKAKEKRQFQIKLPSTICAVRGVLIEARPVHMGKMITATERGWIWLSVPEKRDVFYGETTAFDDHNKPVIGAINQAGLSGESEVWFNGTRKDFFKIDVPLEATLIEAFYVDFSSGRSVHYELKIYLELEVKA